MYIFAEPVTEEQVAEIQGQNEAKIREFERNILGLNREHESEAQDSQEDDGKWDNIQASVQEAMDKDELSVDDPDQNQREAGDDDLTTNGDRALGEELSYDHNSEIAPDEDLIAAIAGDSAEKVGEQNGENSKVLDEGYKKGQEVKEPDEESRDAKDLESEGSSGHGDDELEIHEAVPEGDSAIMGESSDSDLGQSENALDGRELSEGEAAKEVTSVPPDSKSVKKADKAAYLPPLPGEESSESEYQTEADRPFLDSVDRETAQADTSLSFSEILAMTLTIRNKVNNQFIHRPENISPEDVWSIEYSLVEVPTQQKAKALYQACQLRRKKKLDAPMVPEDAEVINHYLANLRDLSKSGKKWRQKMDESDSRKPVQVLGREINMGEGSLSDQESEA